MQESQPLGRQSSPDSFNLNRFVAAQAPVYVHLLAELRAGRKRSHWMWFVFPQIDGLGRSAMAQQYAIESLVEARAYLDHAVLGPRLRECTQAAVSHTAKSAFEIFGTPDDLKFRSSMTLFAEASGEHSVYETALELFFDAEPDKFTLRRLAEIGE